MPGTLTSRITLGVILGLAAAAGIAFFFGSKVVGTWLASPALVLLIWGFVGHLVTLDDDATGGWSNPQESKTMWYRSLGELMAKLVLLVGLSVLVISQW